MITISDLLTIIPNVRAVADLLGDLDRIPGFDGAYSVATAAVAVDLGHEDALPFLMAGIETISVLGPDDNLPGIEFLHSLVESGLADTFLENEQDAGMFEEPAYKPAPVEETDWNATATARFYSALNGSETENIPGFALRVVLTDWATNENINPESMARLGAVLADTARLVYAVTVD